jgi:hypothetical protein
MADTFSLLRFFHAVTPSPPLMPGAFLVALVVGSAIVLVEPARTADVLEPLLLLQLFAASSGFAGPARRGYYDMLLARGDRRGSIAAAHWLMSIAPGVASWLALGLAEMVSRGAFPGTSYASGTVAATILISTLPWAFTAALPRFSGAIGWLAVLLMATSLWRLDEVALDEMAGAGVSVTTSLAVLIHPGLLVGQPLGGSALMVVAPAIGVAVVAMTLACLWIVRADFALEWAQ